MPRLKSRQMQIPGSFRFYIPQLKWEATPHASFNTIVNEITRVLEANPRVASQMGLAINYDSIANALDEFNARVCEANGWNSYVQGGAAAQPPFPRQSNAPGFLQRATNVAASAKPVIEFINSAEEAVPRELATKRAEVCTRCPLNGRGSFLRWFTVPAAAAIQAAIERKRGMKLSTVHDHQLGVCEACECPLTLKVHFPLNRIVDNMPAAPRAALHPMCWIIEESGNTA